MVLNEQTKKGKLKLLRMADAGERDEMFLMEMGQVQDRVDELQTALAEGATKKEIQALLASISKDTDRMRATYANSISMLTNSLKEQHEAFLATFKEMHGAWKRQGELTQVQMEQMGGFFKDFPTMLGTNTKHTKRMADVVSNLKWNSSMQVRNQNGSPMTPMAVGQEIGSGNGTVVTSGTPVKLSTTSVECTRVIVYSNSANSSLTNNGIIVVGDSNVVALEASRRGASIYPTNGLELYVRDLSLVYVDATDNGAKFHYTYEKPF